VFLLGETRLGSYSWLAASHCFLSADADSGCFNQERVARTDPVSAKENRQGRCSLRVNEVSDHGPPATHRGYSNHATRRSTSHENRKWKLDELPQLFNVLSGEMSLVGPRPDLPEYLQTLSVQQFKVLTLSPGITSAASLEFRNEELLLTEVTPEQVERFYVNTLLPRKIEIELAYAREASFLGDIAILLRTAAAIFH
jgi:hypothetical protein